MPGAWSWQPFSSADMLPKDQCGFSCQAGFRGQESHCASLAGGPLSSPEWAKHPVFYIKEVGPTQGKTVLKTSKSYQRFSLKLQPPNSYQILSCAIQTLASSLGSRPRGEKSMKCPSLWKRHLLVKEVNLTLRAVPE